MIKYFSDDTLYEVLESAGKENEFDSIVEHIKESKGLLVLDHYDTYRFLYRESELELSNELKFLEDFLADNLETIQSCIESMFGEDEHEEISLGELNLDLSGHEESTALTLDDAETWDKLLNSDDPVKYLKETLYFDRSMEIASNIQEVISDLRSSPYGRLIDWNIIIDSLPQEAVYRMKIFEVFDETGASKGLYENYNAESAATYAYNSYNPNNKKWSSEVNWTAQEVAVYGFNPNRRKLQSE